MTACRIALLITFALCAAMPASAAKQPAANDVEVTEWNFAVYLGESRVGYHRFRLERDDDRRRLFSEADFEVKLLFLTLYRYRHENTEAWNGECLERIESRTNANGKQFSVLGSQGSDAFEVKATGLYDKVPGCVKTFAYWNPDFLRDSALLNPQTGEVLPVVFEPLDAVPIEVRGHEVEARRYRLRADGMDLELWYSQDDEWLGLRSTTEDGRTIQYRLT